MLDFLREIRVSAAHGVNNFTMTRGSFRYDQDISDRRSLSLLKTIEKNEGFDLVFGASDEEFVFSVGKENGLIKATFTIPEDSEFNRFCFTFPCEKGLHFYGLGEVHSQFDLRGEKIRVFVAEHQNSDRIDKKVAIMEANGGKYDKVLPLDSYESYYAQPTFTTSQKWFFHADTKGFSELDLTKDGEISFTTQEPPVFWIGQGGSFEEVSEKMTNLIGRQKSLPDWIYDGAIPAVQGGTEIIDQKIEKALTKGAEICGIWSQDWCGCRRTGFGYQVMWNWQWDRELYKDLDKKIKEWKARGIRFLGYINPFMAIEKELYRYASSKGYCVKDKEGKDYLVTITTFPAAMIDLTNPDAWEWYKSVIKENMIGFGLGGWMADFGEYLPTDCVLYSGEDPEFMHNQWPALWAKLNREAVDEAGAGDDVFFFTRAGYTGTAEYSPMMWTGDQHVDWSTDDGIPSVIPATLSLAMSGFGITHSDVGGYTTIAKINRCKELLLRWEEMNAFSPLYRFHEGNRPTLNVQFDEDDELLEQLARMSRIHKGLKPYLKELEKLNCERGIPVIRPLFYHYDEEKAYTETTEYLLGRDMLVAPVLKEGRKEREVWLPEDDWVHIFTKNEYHGGDYTIEAPFGYPPVFIRKNSKYCDCFLSLI
ncbi:MAG: alpha-glucosidase [Clostridiales bacterium]|nr:alpha-glucosidase [Clostridiales bacterium]